MPIARRGRPVTFASEQQAREQGARAALLHTQEQIASTEKQAQTLSSREQQLEKLSAAVVRSVERRPRTSTQGT